MDNILLFGFLVVLIGALVTSAKLVEGSFTAISSKFKINQFILGFFAISIITSLPEISIALMSSNTSPELSLGNLIGASIVILTLIIGISAIKYNGIEFKKKFSQKEVSIGLLLVLLIVIVTSDRTLSVLDGIILLLSYALFILYLYKRFSSTENKSLYTKINNTRTLNIFIKGTVGIFGIIISSSYVVSTAEIIALNFGIPQAVIGILMLAIGTNLPELTLLIISKAKESSDIIIGGFFGSVCVNVASLGVLAIISGGFEITGFMNIVSGIVILFLTIVTFLIFSWTGKKLSKTEGILLVVLYGVFVLSEIIILFL
jgi:cation:H+ antiporter